MTDDLTFEARLETAYQRFLDGAPVAGDPRAFVASLVAAGARPGRRAGWRERLSVVGGASARPGDATEWRSVIPVRVAVVALVVLLAASLAFATGALRWPPRTPVVDLPPASFLPSGSPQATREPATPPPPSVPVVGEPHVGRIVVTAGEMTYLGNPDGSWTPLPGVVANGRGCPTLSPDGRHIAYFSGPLGIPRGRLQMADADGRNVRLLWSGIIDEQTFHQVVWSPDSSLVAGTKARTAARDMLMVIGHADGAPATVLPWGMGEFEGSIAWSPDGREMAVVAARPKNRWAIEVRPINGGAVKGIAVVEELYGLAWSSTSGEIAYIAAEIGDGTADLHFVHPDGSNDRVVARGPRGHVGLALLTWSPDGSRLAMMEYVDDQPTYSLDLFDGHGSSLGSLGEIAFSGNLAMSWSPDGNSVLLTTAGPNEMPLIVDLDGEQHPLVVPDGYYTQCALGWAPAVP